MTFPSREFNDAVAAVCHGSASDEELQGIHELLRGNSDARDEYLLRVEIHSRLASDPDVFGITGSCLGSLPPIEAEHPEAPNLLPFPSPGHGWRRHRNLAWIGGVAACLVLLAAGWFGLGLRGTHSPERAGATSTAIAMLNRAVDAEWEADGEVPRLGSPLEPGWFRLKSGLAQIVFYSGARLVIEGPAELQLISAKEAICRRGRVTAEVPPQARGFRIATPHTRIHELGTSFGLQVGDLATELHVFKGSVLACSGAGAPEEEFQEGSGVLLQSGSSSRAIPENLAAFASLFELQSRSLAAETLRFDQWRASSRRMNHDPSLLIHLGFENAAGSEWRLQNTGSGKAGVSDATIVGCQWTEGRWPDKPALAFQSVNDRLRVSVPGRFNALTLAAWVRVQGLDRQFNSLFMCDGFEPGGIHWLIRHDGVLSIAVKGFDSTRFQILASPPVMTLDRLGLWIHLAVVLDGDTRRAVHYVNGRPVSESVMEPRPPFRVGNAELGNWNIGRPSDQDADPFLIRNFSGAIDEFCLFDRALSDAEMRELYANGKP